MRMLTPLRARQPRELLPVAVVGLLAGLVWAAAEVVDEVVEGDTRQLDQTVLLFFRTAGEPGDPLGPMWFEGVVRDLTALGGLAVLTLVVTIAVGYFILQRRWRTALFLLASVSGGALLSFALKTMVGRARPPLSMHGMEVWTASFPSGHAMLSTITYLTLGALVARSLSTWGHRLYVVAVSITVSLIVGLTRVYLGVHWPSDVVAGWTIGAIWAIGCGLLAHVLQRHERIEPLQEGDQSDVSA